MTEPAIQFGNPLALTQCPRCDYDLHGLPPDGVCPECGRPYDQKTIVLRGWGAGRLSSRGPNFVLWFGYCCAMPYLVDSDFGFFAAMFFVLLGTNAVNTFRRPSIRVVMSERGCKQYFCPSTTSWWNWNSWGFQTVFVILIVVSVWLLDPSRGHRIFFSIAGAIGFVSAMRQHWRTQNIRKAAEANGEYFDEYESTAQLAPWTKAQSLRVIPINYLDRTRLRITSS